MKIGSKNVLFPEVPKMFWVEGVREGGGRGGGLKRVGRDTANNFFMDGLMVLRCGLKFRHSV